MSIFSLAAPTVAARATIETRTSWAVCLTALGVAAVSYGAPVVTVVGLKQIAADLGNERSVPSLAYSLAWLGPAWGGLVMSRVAARIGVRWTVMFSALMIAIGMALASSGGRVSLLVGYGVFVGVLGNGGINAPLYIYVSQWFDRRRGTALALMGSGASVAAAIWAPIFAPLIANFGWRHTMLIFAVAELALIVPAAFAVLAPAPVATDGGEAASGPRPGELVLGLRANTALVLLAVASFLCCVPMAMPQGHLVAFCSDVGIPASQGAWMLSVLLGCAFVSRQFWGLIADRYGGVWAVFAGSACQITAMVGFLLTQNEAGLFAVSAWFGLGFSGIIPAYVLAVRELFPTSEASWRVPMVLLFSGSGMAFGGWLAGLIYDHFGLYTAAFATGIVFNVAHLLVIGVLVWRQQRYASGPDGGALR
jgi:MFS family permease